MSPGTRGETWKWTSTHRGATTGGYSYIAHLKAVKTKREHEREHFRGEFCGAERGDSRMHSTATKQQHHHLDRVKTSDVTIAMCPFVCVSLRLCYVAEMPHQPSAPALAQLIHWDSQPATISVFVVLWLINEKRRARNVLGRHRWLLITSEVKPNMLTNLTI